MSERGGGRKMRWPYPFFPLLFIVFGPHKSRWKLQASRIHAANNQGDHMLLSRGKFMAFLLYVFFFLRPENWKMAETAESFAAIPLSLSRRKSSSTLEVSTIFPLSHLLIVEN